MLISVAVAADARGLVDEVAPLRPSPRSCRTPSIPAAPRAPRRCPAAPAATADGRTDCRSRCGRRELRRSGDNRDTTMLYTSNGSARAHQRSPHTQRSGQGDGQVDQQPNPDRGKRSRVGAGQFQPHEREQAQRRRPVAQRLGIAAQRPCRRAAGAPCAPARAPATPVRAPATAPPGRPTAARRTRRAAGSSASCGPRNAASRDPDREQQRRRCRRPSG